MSPGTSNPHAPASIYSASPWARRLRAVSSTRPAAGANVSAIAEATMGTGSNSRRLRMAKLTYRTQRSTPRGIDRFERVRMNSGCY